MPKPPAAPFVGVDLHPVPVTSLSVYVHIPFCSSRCNYCDFYFETTRSPRVIAATLERIIEEAEYFMEMTDHPRIVSLYFGGGTPSVVPPALLDSFLERLRSVLRLDEPSAAAGPHEARARDRRIEATFEATPESMSDELVEVLRRRGINRVSLGVQSFDDRSLRALTRRADRAKVVAALERLRDARLGAERFRLNVDLITGIPGQTAKMVEDDVEAAAAFGVDHFSVYSLTVEEHTPLKQALDKGIRTMPQPARQDDLWLDAKAAIVERGFSWYEISNFARPGCRSEHNLGYWRLDPYLGLGPGAVSTIPMVRAASDAAAPSPVRLTNPNLFIYASRLDRKWQHRAEELAASSFLFEHFITGLRTDEGVSLGHLERIAGLDLAERWKNELGQWKRDGVADAKSLDAGRLVLTPRGRLALDRHLLEIDDWIDALGPLAPARWPDTSDRQN